MTKSKIDVPTAQGLLETLFAPWVLDLGLKVEHVGPDGAVMRLPYSDQLCRADKVISGQALMATIDTTSVFVCWGGLGETRNVTTVSQNTSFLRPAIGVDVLAKGRVIKSGRTLIFLDVALYSAPDDKQVAHATSTFALLPGGIGDTPG